MPHIPVMVQEVLQYLLHAETKLVFEGTTGLGNHSKAILSANPNVSLIGVDRDPRSLSIAKGRLEPFGERATLIEGVFGDVDVHLRPFGKVDGAFLDLGFSTDQIEAGERGFSYLRNGPLDMRMDEKGKTARDIIAESNREQLADIFKQYGEVPMSSKLAGYIKQAESRGEMNTTFDLKRIIAAALGRLAGPSLFSKCFQALRIKVNKEMEHLDRFLMTILDLMNPEGRLVFIAYHSLEDVRIKNFLKRESTDCICPPKTPVCICHHEARLDLLTPKVLKPSQTEIAGNPNARSAKFRAARVL